MQLFSIFSIIIFAYSTIVNPEIDDTVILDNPYMGYQISSAGESDYYNYSTIYLRSSGSCRIDGEYVSMEGLNWNTLNPSEGTYDFSMIDNLINCCKSLKKFGHIRMRNIIGHSDQPTIPEWLNGIVPKSEGLDSSGDPDGVEAHYYSCSFLKYWGDLVEALRIKIIDEPWINMVDIGSVGYYGEWYNCKLIKDVSAGYWEYDPNKTNIRITLDTIRRIIRMFSGGKDSGRCINSEGQEVEVEYDYPGFDTKYIFISEGDTHVVRMGIGSGAGWRYDIIGTFEEMGWAAQWATYYWPLLGNKWKYFPNVGEFPKELDISMYWDKAICQAKSFHVSAVHDNHDDKPLPEDKFSEYFRLIGYRIYVEEAEYESSVASGNDLDVTITFLNIGTAPPYKKYPIFLYLKKKDVSEPIMCQKYEQYDVRTILPDDVIVLNNNFTVCETVEAESVDFEITFPIPSWIASSTDYSLYFTIMEDVRQSPIQLAMKEKDSKGRYLIGDITVTGSGSGVPPEGITTCDENIDWIPLDQNEFRPIRSSENDVVEEKIVFSPLQDGWSYKWGEADQERLCASDDSREIYLQFDFTSLSSTDFKFNSLELLMVPWSRIDYIQDYHVDIFYGDWDENTLSNGEWDDRPSQSAVGRTFIGNYTHNGVKYTTFNPKNSDVQEYMIGKKFTIMIYGPTDCPTAYYASTRRNNGLVAPYFAFYIDKSEDHGGDVLYDSSIPYFTCFKIFFTLVLIFFLQ